MKEITRQWLEYAKADLMNCERIMGDAYLTNIVAFHSQQSVEKCFKAIIEENGVKLPRIHSLHKLYTSIGNLISFDVEIEKLEILDKIYTSSRYPGETGLLPQGKPNINEANEMFEFANDVYLQTIKQVNKI